MCVLVAQLCLTLCYPMDCSLTGSSIRGILQARILAWVTFPSPRDPPDPGIEPGSPALQADSLLSQPPGKYTIFSHLWDIYWAPCAKYHIWYWIQSERKRGSQFSSFPSSVPLTLFYLAITYYLSVFQCSVEGFFLLQRAVDNIQFLRNSQ